MSKYSVEFQRKVASIVTSVVESMGYKVAVSDFPGVKMNLSFSDEHIENLEKNDFGQLSLVYNRAPTHGEYNLTVRTLKYDDSATKEEIREAQLKYADTFVEAFAREGIEARVAVHKTQDIIRVFFKVEHLAEKKTKKQNVKAKQDSPVAENAEVEVATEVLEVAA